MTTDAAPIPLMQCPIAGFQFHGGERCQGRIRPGDPLELRREPGNRHDPRAITVAWQGVTLGYVPREANYALSQMMDRGARVAARVTTLREGGDPWQRVLIEVAVGTQPAAPVVAKPPAHEEVILVPGLPMHYASLTLAPLPMASVPPELNRFEPVLKEIWAEAARRLGEPLRGIREPHAREVILWGSVALRIGADGRELSARFLEEPTRFHSPFLTHDLKRPIGERSWSGCVLRSLGAVQPWTLIDVAGKMNAAVNEKIARVAEGVVAKMKHWAGPSPRPSPRGEGDGALGAASTRP